MPSPARSSRVVDDDDDLNLYSFSLDAEPRRSIPVDDDEPVATPPPPAPPVSSLVGDVTNGALSLEIQLRSLVFIELLDAGCALLRPPFSELLCEGGGAGDGGIELTVVAFIGVLSI